MDRYFPERLRSWEDAILADLDNDVLISAATVYEVSYKILRGKLPEAADFERDMLAGIAKLGFTLLPITPAVMHRAARFPAAHADPFDRMIAAQAIELDLDVLSTDPALDAFGVRRLRPPA